METIAFARGVPAPEMLPVDELRDAAREAFDADPVRILSYGTGGGYPPLREHIAQAQRVEPAQVILTSGSLQAFSLVIEFLGEQARAAGRRPVAIVENPTYDRPLILLQRAGWDVEHVPLDTDGVDVEALAAVLERTEASLVYLIPTYQNPAGSTLSEERRGRVLELVARAGVPLLEDDPYGQLHFDTPAPATLFERDSDALVLYSSSYSKTISPGLRVGYVVLPQQWAAAVEQRANDTYISPSLLAEATVLHFLRSGGFEPNLERIRTQLRERCRRICTALDEHLPEAGYVAPAGGYFLWARLPGVSDTSQVLQAALREGVSFVPGAAFGPGNGDAVRLAFSSAGIDSIADGVRRLATALATVPVEA